MEDMSKSQRELIQQYLEYDEDKDQGGHKYAAIMKGLSKIVGSQDPAKINQWVTEQASTYETRTSSLSDIERQTYSESQMHIRQKIAEATNQKDKAFYERLLRLSSLEEDRASIQ